MNNFVPWNSQSLTGWSDKYATGKFVLWQNADDIFFPRAFSAFVDFRACPLVSAQCLMGMWNPGAAAIENRSRASNQSSSLAAALRCGRSETRLQRRRFT